MENCEFIERMECLQFSGHPVKFFAHPVNQYNQRKPFFSRVIAEEYARQNGLIVSAAFVESK